ncbi:MAG TPA: hypothetical protein VHV31_11070 [Nitrolancea sp.]|nr:hypothetical protein [Nitrolancea sp.]
MMTADVFDFWFPGSIERLANDARERDEWIPASVDAARTLRHFDDAGQPHSIELNVIEHPSSPSASLPELCVQVLNALQSANDATGTEIYAMRWLVQIHATLRLASQGAGVRVRVQADSESEVHVAGTLLVDLRQNVSNGASPSSDWLRLLRTELEHNSMARAGAEYAIAIDLPREPGLVGPTSQIESSLRVIEQVARLLPQEPLQVSMLPELWIQAVASDNEPAQRARLRVWRLGYMKIARQSSTA